MRIKKHRVISASMYLVLCEAHLYDSPRIESRMIRVLLVLLPPEEVRRVLAMGVACGFSRQHCDRKIQKIEEYEQVEIESVRE